MKEVAVSVQENHSAKVLIRWEYWIPVLLCLILMVPRLISPQFGLFDDGVTIGHSRQIATSGLDPGMEAGAGRFRPFYWLYYALIYILAGTNPLAFFLGNTIILACTTAGIVVLVKKMGGTPFQAFTSGIVFSLSGPVFENYYTLSKGELLQVGWVVAALVLANLFSLQQPRWQQGVILFAGCVSMLLVMVSKETSVIFIPISFVWLALAIVWKTVRHEDRGVLKQAVFFGITLLAGLTYFAWRAAYLQGGMTTGTYASGYSFEIRTWLDTAIVWLSWFRRDFSWLLFFLLACILLPIFSRRLSRFTLDYINQVIWMIAWIAIFIPWNYVYEYYLLPFCLGAAILSGLILGEIVGFLKDKTQAKAGKAAIGFALGAGLFFWIAMSPTFYSNGRIQLEVDRVNDQMMAYISRNAPPNTTVYVNLPADDQYVIEISNHFGSINHRPDIKVGPFAFQTATPKKNFFQAWILSPYIYNLPLLTARSGVYERENAGYQASLKNFLGIHANPEYVQETRFNIVVIDALRLFCPLIRRTSFCSLGVPGLDQSQFRYGWRVYQYQSQIDEIALPGSWDPNGTWTLQRSDGTLTQIQFGNPGDQPVVGDWDGNGRSDLGVYRASNQSWYLDENLDGKPEINFKWDEMKPGDVPVAGQWDGKGMDLPGFFRPSDTSWHFKLGWNKDSPELPVSVEGRTNDIPLVGDWYGAGKSSYGVYQPDTGKIILAARLSDPLKSDGYQIQPGVKVIAGNWAGNGKTTLAYQDDRGWNVIPVLCDCDFSNLRGSFQFPVPDGEPLAGQWGKP